MKKIAKMNRNLIESVKIPRHCTDTYTDTALGHTDTVPYPGLVDSAIRPATHNARYD